MIIDSADVLTKNMNKMYEGEKLYKKAADYKDIKAIKNYIHYL